jgi:hypothetical protein
VEGFPYFVKLAEFFGKKGLCPVLRYEKVQATHNVTAVHMMLWFAFTMGLAL